MEISNVNIGGASAADVMKAINAMNTGTVVTSATQASDNVLTVTMSQGGIKTTFNVTLQPDLDPAASATDDVVSLEEFTAKLEALSKDVAKLGQSGSTQPSTSSTSSSDSAVRTSSVFTSIFQTILLLMEVMEEQKKTASQVKRSESQNRQSQLEQEATAIKSAGETAHSFAIGCAITSACMTAASGAMTVFSTYNSVKSITNSGVTGAGADLKSAESVLKTATEDAKSTVPTQGPGTWEEVVGKGPTLVEAKNASVPQGQGQEVEMAEVHNQNPQQPNQPQVQNQPQNQAPGAKVEQNDNGWTELKVKDGSSTEELVKESKEVHVENVQATVDMPKAAATDAKVTEARGNLEQAKQVQKSVSAEVTKAQGEVTACELKLAEVQGTKVGSNSQFTSDEAKTEAVKTAQKNLDAANTNLASKVDLQDRADANVKGCQVKLTDALVEKQTAMKQDVAGYEADVKAAQDEVKAAQDALKTEQSAKPQGLSDLVDKTGLGGENKAKTPAEQKLDAAKAKLEKAQSDLACANFQLRQESIKMAPELKECAAAKVESCQAKMDAAANRMMNGVESKKAMAFAGIGNFCNQLNQTICEILKGESALDESESEANEKEYEKNAEASSLALDETKDLVASAQKSIDQLLTLMQTITQKDSETMQSALRA